MLKVGTVCYLTGNHGRAGQCCTTTSPLAIWTIAETGRPAPSYRIDLASGERSTLAKSWGARPEQLIPIAPPGLTDDTDQPQEVTA